MILAEVRFLRKQEKSVWQAGLRRFVEQIFETLHDEQVQKSGANTRRVWEAGLHARHSENDRRTGQGDSQEDPGSFEVDRRRVYLKQRPLANSDGGSEGNAGERLN